MSGILADQMGLGKTVQSLALLVHLKKISQQSGGRKSSLVICPLSVLNNWLCEARQFAPGLRVLAFHGPPKERAALKKRIHQSLKSDTSSLAWDLIVTNYEAYEKEVSWLRSQVVWECVILDEGHKIKSCTTKISHALQNIRCNLRLILTGTPVQNNLEELRGLLHWLFPEVFGDGTDDLFKRSFDLSRGAVDDTVLTAAARLLRVVMLRRTMESPGVNLRLPPLREVVLSLPLTDLQRDWYLKLITKSEDVESTTTNQDTQDNRAVDAVGKSAFVENPVHNPAPTRSYRELLNLMLQLRKISNHPYMIDGAAPVPYDPYDHVVGASTKFIALQKLIQQLVVVEKRKIIIFSGFMMALDLVEELLHLLGGDGPVFRYVRLDGSTAVARRNLSVRLFQDTDSDYRVFLISTRAGGQGLNLQAASEIVFLDEDWNPQMTLQARARAYRIGQTKPVTVYKLCTEGTVEAQMLGRIYKKLYLSARITDLAGSSSSGQPSSPEAAQNDTSSAQLGFADLTAMIRRGTQALSLSSIDVQDLQKWDLATMLARCTLKEDAIMEEAGELDVEVGKQWLSAVERVKCRDFQGARYEKTKKVEELEMVELDRSDRRLNKNTTVMVDG